MPLFKAVTFSSLMLLLGSSSNVSSFAPNSNGPLGRRSPSNSIGVAPTTSSTTSLCMSSQAYGRNFYHILGLTSLATAKDIKSAFRQMAKKYHPDLNKGEGSTELFQEVNRAYEVLRDPRMRMKYDMHGESGVGTSAASDYSQANTYSSPFNDDRFRSSYRRPATPQDEDLGGFYDPFAYRSSNEKFNVYNKNTRRESPSSRGEQIPCDQPNHGARSRFVHDHDDGAFDPFNAQGSGLRSEIPYTENHSKSAPFDEFVRSKMDEHARTTDFHSRMDNERPHTAETPTVPFDEFVKSKMQNDPVWGTEHRHQPQQEPEYKSIPFDEFVRSKMESECYVPPPEVDIEDGPAFDPYFGVVDIDGHSSSSPRCDQGGDFPFRGDDQLFKRTGPGQARESSSFVDDKLEPQPVVNSPFQGKDFTEDVFVSASIFSNEQMAAARVRPSSSTASRGVMMTEQVQVKTPTTTTTRRRSSAKNKHLVMEASEMWRPVSPKLRP